METEHDYRCTQAFTLIELLVVIAVFSVLLAILLPALNGARARARQQKCAGQLRSIALGLILYAEDNKNTLLLRGIGGNPEFEFGGWRGNPLYEYALCRPVNPHVQPGLSATGATEEEARVFRCPADAGDVNSPTPFYETYGNSYRANTILVCPNGIPGARDPWGPLNSAINGRRKSLLMTNVPAATILVGDYNWLTQLDPEWGWDAKSWHGRWHRHNLAFADGRVAHVRIRKGIYLEQGVYRWHPYTDLDHEVLQGQQEVH